MSLKDEIGGLIGDIADALPDAAHTMTHGEDERGRAVQSSSREYGDVMSEDAPVEVARYIVNAGAFPTLSEGAAVELDGSLRAVTSMRSDPIGASYTVGLSAEFEKSPAKYVGVRRENERVRRLDFPLDVLTLENGVAGNTSAAIAPTYAASFTVGVRRADWTETSDPDPSDKLTIAPNGIPVTLKVSSVTRHGGWFVMKCRTRD